MTGLSETSTQQEINRYVGRTEKSLEEALSVLKMRILAPTQEGREKIRKEIEGYVSAGMSPEEYAARTKALDDYDTDIAQANADITQAEAALAALK